MADTDSQLKIYKKGWIAAVLFLVYVVVGLALVSRGPNGDFYPLSSWDLFSEPYAMPTFYDLEITENDTTCVLSKCGRKELDSNLLWFLAQNVGKNTDEKCQVPEKNNALDKLKFELSRNDKLRVKLIRVTGNFYQYIFHGKFDARQDCFTAQ